MKENIEESIIIPEDVEAAADGNRISVKGKNGEIQKIFLHNKIKIRKDGHELILNIGKSDRRDKAVFYTFKAHINNMIKGVREGHQYRLKICYSHFPINVEVKGEQVLIKNFLGEKVPRKTKLMQGVNAKVDGEHIILNGIDIEKVGQSAANIESVCNIKHRDRRVFQDGCFIIMRGNKA